jgi:putative PIN family toxin of toxin-antitoxin system
MILVIDTNSLLQALAAGNPLRPLLDAWFAGRLTWAMSNEILFEYQEVITLRSGAERWQRLIAMLDIVEQARPATLLRISPNFHFHLITADADDNKFADCAIAAEAEFVITDDAHFGPLANSGYKPQPITPTEFILRHLRSP